MAQIRHHLTDALLMGYAAGALPEAFNLVVATHVSVCDECRSRMHAFDAIGGAVMEDAGCATLAGDSFAATMARIAGTPPQERARAQAPSQASRIGTVAAGSPVSRRSVFPAPLRDYVNGDLEAVRWRRIGGGVSQAVLPTSRDATVRLLRIPGGAAVPDHGHRGTELTLVLQGAFRDATDRFGAGDVEVADEAMVHTPVAEPGEDCICLAATDAPLRFSAFLPRIVQPFLRI